MFRCEACGDVFEDDLPPFWTGNDCWPVHCDQLALLFEPVERPLNWTDYLPEPEPAPPRGSRLFSGAPLGVMLYFTLDTVSRFIPGPMSHFDIDDKVRLFERLGNFLM